MLNNALIYCLGRGSDSCIFLLNITNMSTNDANRANNGANKAMKISETEATSSMIEKNGFARPSVNIEESPLPTTVADWIDRDVPPPAIIARAH